MRFRHFFILKVVCEREFKLTKNRLFFIYALILALICAKIELIFFHASNILILSLANTEKLFFDYTNF